MERAIIGFDQDELGDWRAILACGHRQHVRHNPPLVSRPWVLTEEGRARFLGVALECKACDEGEPVGDGMIAPDALEAAYRQFQAELERLVQPRAADPGAAEAVLAGVYRELHARAGQPHEDRRPASWLDALAHDTTAGPALAVWGLLACLPGQYRQALILTKERGMTPPAIAERLDISEAEAQSRVARGYTMLREALLDCCHFVFEQTGRVLPYQPGCAACAAGHQLSSPIQPRTPD